MQRTTQACSLKICGSIASSSVLAKFLVIAQVPPNSPQSDNVHYVKLAHENKPAASNLDSPLEILLLSYTERRTFKVLW